MQKSYNEIGSIMAFECGELDDVGVVELFQHLVDSGLAWKLQGTYGRTAKSLIDAGIIHERQEAIK